MFRRAAAVLCAVVPAITMSVLLGAGDASGAPGSTSSATADTALTQPVYSYRDAVRESVWVQAPTDSDQDGRPDRIAVDIVRPRTATRVPTIMDASPYYSCCGRGNQYQLKTYDASGTIASMPLFYDNYFVPRGYAYVAVDLPGTNRSDGCPDLGGPNEIAAVSAVIGWLRGHGAAYSARTGGAAVPAYWSAGRVGMIGKSWDASVANGVAATGVAGLRTVVDISGISSWYDYDRFGGVRRYSGAVQALDDVVDARPDVCDPVIAAQQAAAGDRTGNLNAFWARRDYRPDASKVRASVLMSHGLNDENVTTNQFSSWWQDLSAHGVPRQLWLSQDGHVDPFDYRRAAWVEELHRWFDRWLMGRADGVMNRPQVSIQRPDGQWTTAATWPVAGATSRTYGLATAPRGAGSVGARYSGEVAWTDRAHLDEDQAVDRPDARVTGRASFLGGVLRHPVHISGAGSVTLRVRVSQPTTEFTARIVDYGRQRRIDWASSGEGIVTDDTKNCWGQSSAADGPCYFVTHQKFVTSDVDVLSRGWLDAAHHQSVRTRTPLVPGHWYTVTVPLAPIEDVVARGHRLGLVLSGSDTVDTDPASSGARVRIDLTGSSLSLPIAGRGL